MASERSSASLITGENAERTKARSISLQTCCSPFWMTARVIGSTGSFSYGDDEIPQRVDDRAIARFEHRGAVELLDDRRAVDTRGQALAPVHRRFAPSPGKPHPPRNRVCGFSLQELYVEARPDADYCGVKIDEDRANLRKLDAEALEIGTLEKRLELGAGDARPGQRNGEDMDLALE